MLNLHVDNTSHMLIFIHLFIFFTDISCGSAPAVQYATRWYDDECRQRAVTYACYPGYNHTAGPVYKTCNDTGHWVPEQDPVCTGTLPGPEFWENTQA